MTREEHDFTTLAEHEPRVEDLGGGIHGRD
jgi:hypothetical protein